MNSLRSKLIKNVARTFQTRNSSIGTTLQNSVWQKSTMRYITYVGVACIVAEAIYGAVTNSIWDTYNKGVILIL